MENENELQDSLTPEEEVNSSEPVENAEGDTADDKFAKLEESNKKLFARAKKAEEELKAFKTTPKEVEKPAAQPVKAPVEDLDRLVEEKLNERELASMDLSDTLKTEVKAYAKAKDISYREAAKSDYFNYVKGMEDARRKAEEASASSSGNTTKARRDFSNLSDEDIKNLPDEDYKEYKTWLKTQG